MLRPFKQVAIGPGIILNGRRFALLEHRTKGCPHMKHLDLYARRDPQLAPYLLREVDIEFKRKCRKVNFLIWGTLFTMAILLQARIQSESVHHLRNYAYYVRDRQEAKDKDSIIRRKALVHVLGIIVDAYNRDQKWTESDARKAEAGLC